MPVRSRSALPFGLAMAIASMAIARPAQAQDVSLAPAPVTAAAAPVASAPVGPTMEVARVGVRHNTVVVAPAQQRRAGLGQPAAMMIVGGAAVLTGLIIGDGVGTAIAVGGAVVGLIGLYQYLQ